MDRIQDVIQDTLGVCQQHRCSLNAVNLCMTHTKKLCNYWGALFHYDWNLKIMNGEEFIQATMEDIDYLVDSMLDEGIKFGVDKEYSEFNDQVTALKTTS